MKRNERTIKGRNNAKRKGKSQNKTTMNIFKRIRKYTSFIKSRML